MHCNYDQGGQILTEQQQQEQQPTHVVDAKLIGDDVTTENTPSTTAHAHNFGHCHHHIKQQQQQQSRSNTTTPTQTRRQSTAFTKSHAHSHSHSHNHSPHNSRHTSPHSYTSHSCHTSPHQSQNQLPALKNSNEQQAHATTHHHHHHRRRQKRAHSHSHAHAHADINDSCSRRHRSVTDISSNSLNTLCQDTLCTEQQLLVQRRCCTSSRTELAQYFAEDLYGSSSRRPSSCCTSSDYCYQTDSTSLYGSRSSHESIKSGSLQQQRKKPNRYSNMSLRARSQPTSQNGSLASIYDAQHKHSTKVHIHRHTSKDALSNDLPQYACSPSPIRWSFLGQLDDEEHMFAQTALSAGRKTSTASEGRERDYQRHRARHTSWKKSVDALPSALKRNTSERDCHRERECWQKSVDTLPTVLKSSSSWKKSADELPSALKRNSNERERKRDYSGTKPKKTSWKDNQDAHAQRDGDRRANKTTTRKTNSEFEESSNTVLYHQEAEAFNNCCSNYIQCNTYLDQDLQITSEDIHQYLNKGSHQRSINGQMPNTNSSVQNYPFQPSNALEYQYKNNFANSTDMEMDANCQCRNDPAQSQQQQQRLPLSRKESSSSQNINMEAQQVKFIVNNNTSTMVSSEAHHSGYLPYTYPSYDYTNMCSNTQTEALAVEQRSTTSASDDQYSSLLQSPGPVAVSFESFDAASEHKLLSPQSPRSASPASSTLSAAINPAAAGPFVHHHYNYQGADYHQHQQAHHLSQPHAHAYAHPHQHHHHQHQHLSDSFKLSHAFRNVRKRARKYTDFLRKK